MGVSNPMWREKLCCVSQQILGRWKMPGLNLGKCATIGCNKRGLGF